MARAEGSSDRRPHPATVAPLVAAARWTRRTWLTRTATTLAVVTPPRWFMPRPPAGPSYPTAVAARHATQAMPLQDPSRWQALARRAIEAAQQAGAQYADIRLTRTIWHFYKFDIPAIPDDTETVGIGVRALCNGYWGFISAPTGELEVTPDAVVSVAQAAVAQAKANAAGGTPRTVDMGVYPRVTGTWATPVAIDPFAVSIEEKGAYIAYWMTWARQQGVSIDPLYSHLRFLREERVVATSEGSLVTQTRIESGGRIGFTGAQFGSVAVSDIEGLQTTGKGWELFTTEAKIPEQMAGMRARIDEENALQKGVRPASVGRYTLVCDGATMGSVVGETLGLATQLDRALGYEANAGGTSFLDEPLAMVGQFPVAAPGVTVTGNRSAPAQLATVKWDDEGVEPHDFTLVQDGVLTDFQTTREQATWLAPYYVKQGCPVRSHGCANAIDALEYPLQQRPNLRLEPNPHVVGLEDLVANVQDGILITAGKTLFVDFQARTGMIDGNMRKITNGRLGASLTGGMVYFDTLDLFKHVVAVGGASTTGVVSHSAIDPDSVWLYLLGHLKGQPAQDPSYSVSAAAATITNQPVINPRRKI